MEASKEFARSQNEAGDLSRFEGPLSEEDLKLLLENSESGLDESKELTPERVRRAWDQLSDTEKRFVMSGQKVFEAVLPKYEAQVGAEKASVIKALRKLIQSHDPRAALIESEASR